MRCFKKQAHPSLGPEPETEPWCYAEAAELDSYANGEVLCLVHVKGHIMSSHSEGTIKVWAIKQETTHFLQIHVVKQSTQETGVKEVDLSIYTSTSTVFYAGAKKLPGEQNIHSLCIHNALLFTGGPSVDAIAGKVQTYLNSL
ncbi:hypothetical protein RHMOL_Rhmol06G0201300 [Rhododendron molle]|uniref:Uncharacterized protein n=1 Tax=Rhododendron molle TaxID=49168 RepID=A0ACC0NEK3_RHOML|nr:hypothetical protein RHMOL_Rhmol06G0201300 [Rhododendron molle]